jgi:2-polyprenyl-3-methyl-5-hydroxy-6-metoxy-1,4-benzoquinol methylase
MTKKHYLSTKGLMYLLTRFGGTVLRRLSFNHKYFSGDWDVLDKAHTTKVVDIVEAHANGGDILDMGCGPGHLSEALNPLRYSSYHGVDVSDVALEMARKRTNEKVSFQLSEMDNACFDKQFDVILFEESLYFLPFYKSKKILLQYSAHLKKNGVFIVTIIDVKRFKKLIKMIHSLFAVKEESIIDERGRYLVIFSRKSDSMESNCLANA